MAGRSAALRGDGRGLSGGPGQDAGAASGQAQCHNHREGHRWQRDV